MKDKRKALYACVAGEYYKIQYGWKGIQLKWVRTEKNCTWPHPDVSQSILDRLDMDRYHRFDIRPSFNVIVNDTTE